MIKLLIPILLLLFTSCNPLNLKCTSLSTRVKVNNQWGDFEDWKPMDANVKLKSPIFRGTIPSKLVIKGDKRLVYRFKKLLKNDTTDNGEEYLSFQVKDNKGVECLATFIGKGDSVYFIVNYEDINYCYKLIERK
jgi:hypothetical protein